MMIIEELATYLNNNSIGTYNAGTTGGDIYLNVLPISPDACISINSYGGLSPVTGKGEDGMKFDIAQVQVFVRGVPEDTYTPYERAQSIYNLLAGFHHSTFTAGGKYILNTMAIQSAPAFIGKDDNQRFEYTLNFYIEYQNVDKNY